MQRVSPLSACGRRMPMAAKGYKHTNGWGRPLLVNADPNHMWSCPSYEDIRTKIPSKWGIAAARLAGQEMDCCISLPGYFGWSAGLGLPKLLACKSLGGSRLVFWVVVHLVSFIDLKAGITALLLYLMPGMSSIVRSIESIVLISYCSVKMT